MLIARYVAWMSTAALMTVGTGAAYGQEYPNKPLRIVTGGAGGGSDFASRVIAQALSEGLNQPVIVDNRGNFAADIVSRAPADGYTLYVDGSNFWIGPLLQKTGYDPVLDFSALTLVGKAPNLLVLHSSAAANSVRELIALAKAKPGELNYGSGGSGASTHLAPELFKSMAGVNITRINYKGAGPAVNGLIGGEVQLMIPSASAVAAHVKSGKLKALAVTTAQPSALFPSLPTVAASGVPGYEAVVMTGMFTSGKTPTAIVSRLNREVVRALNRADVKERFLNSGVEVVGSSAEQLTAAIKSEMAKWGKVIKDAGISAE